MTKIAGYYQIVTPSVVEPLTLNDAKAFLRVETTADNSLIEALITAARHSAERYTNRAFISQPWKVSFPMSECGGWNQIQKSPISGTPVAKIWNPETEVFDTDTDAVYIPGPGFTIIKYSQGVEQPTDVPFGIEVTFTAGYSTLPPALLQALKMHVAYLYENRGDVEAVDGVDMPAACKLIYRQYRIIATYG